MTSNEKHVENQARKVNMVVQERISRFLENNACLGAGDLRGEITLEALQRTETKDVWIIERRRCTRADVMEIILDSISAGYSLPSILSIPGFPEGRTVMGWIRDYKPFREMMDIAGQFYGMAKANEAELILDGSDDPKTAYRDKARADLRMRMAEAFNPRVFSKKQIVDHNHHLDDLSSEQVISQFKSKLLSHKKFWEEKLGVQIIVPTLEEKVQDAEVVDETPADPNPETLGMEGMEPVADADWADGLDLGGTDADL